MQSSATRGAARLIEGRLPRIVSVKAVAPSFLRIEWRDGGRVSIDLSGVIGGFPPFAALKDPKLFAQVRIAGLGTGVEWPNGLDYSANSLAALAEEQRQMSGRDFRRWQESLSLSVQETAKIFGVTAGTIKNYRRRHVLPVAVQIACRAMKDNPDTLFAHFRPRAIGRPRKTDQRTAS
jgi:hypothetical protein